MRIGILTFHNSYNFGANLQTLSTQKVLEKCGLEAVVINYVDEQKMLDFARLLSPEQIAEHESFAGKYYSLSPPLTSPEQVEHYCKEELDGVLVGSDAVFRLGTKYEPKRIVKKLLGHDQQFAAFTWEDQLPPFFLPWSAENITKGTVAVSSRGTKFYLLKLGLYGELKCSLSDFDFITVRDEWTAKMVRFLSRGTVNPDICPDPLFGLKASFKLPDEEQVKEDLSDVILVLGDFNPKWLKSMVDVIHGAGYRVAMLPNTYETFANDIADFNLPLPMSPLYWYSCLANCRGFIGERFHAFISCLTNKTPAVTVDISKRMLSKKNITNPNYDLSKRIGITNRYFLKTEIEKTMPEKILSVLFDESSKKLADKYSDNAPMMFEQHVRRVATDGRA